MSKYWVDVFQNAIGCAIGSTVAILFSFLIYWLTSWQNKRAAEIEKISEEVNQLNAFKIMLGRSIDNAENLLRHVSLFVPKLKTYPTDFPLLVVTSLGNFRRIIGSITIEKTGITYIKYFPDDNSVKNFTSILESVDFLYDAFIEMREVVERASKNHFDRVVKVSDKFDIIDKMAIDITSDRLNQNQITQRIAAIKNNFITERGELSDISSIQNLYFLPMTEFMKTIIENGIMNLFIRDFTYNVSKGIEFYNQIGTGYDKFVLEMEGIESTIKENLDKLKRLSEMIMKTNLEEIISR